MNQKSIKQLEIKLGINFHDRELLKTALTHRSYLNEHAEYSLGHNERLEFLGDAVLELLVTEKIFEDYPEENEGILTSVRSAAVRTETLADRSKNLGYGEFLLMSRGEESTGGRERDYILANTFEAVLGAIYLDQGLQVCKNFLENVLFPIIPEIIKNKSYIDSKSQFQELAQEKFKETPYYQTIKEEGPDHEKVFTMAVYVGKKKIAEARGKNKQEAEQAAASLALENWDNLVE